MLIVTAWLDWGKPVYMLLLSSSMLGLNINKVVKHVHSENVSG